ncbi:alpha/beta fold hydrolase [Pseudoclavibacter terrae]|uniref:Alpha/beta hydrolase n=1 Tax=Pseudoclavibacter terrae TaxID=1530195 RepID=A0A7J5B1T6_9MICO|nr:alpha/beta hydrolase [Pseudoclavibacter terrae]KAB1637840.1 alpha/beta hydrolase [Pseudoclavibacter terrae]
MPGSGSGQQGGSAGGSHGGSQGRADARGPAGPHPDPTGAPAAFVVPTGHGVDVHVYEWACASPRGVIHLSHGSGEHAKRYDAYARELVAAGYSVVAHDQLGHGQTGLGSHGLSVLPATENRAALEALEDISAWVRDRYPKLPLILQGHSWGAFLAQQLLARDSAFFSACILTGTALAMPGYTNPGNLNKRFEPDESGLQWMSRDPEQRRRFADDDLCFRISEQPVWGVRGAVQLMHLPPRAASGKLDDIPVLIMAGSEDSVGYGERGPRALARLYRKRSKLSDVTLEIYQGARHELFFELNRDEVIADIVAWLDTRIPPLL